MQPANQIVQGQYPGRGDLKKILRFLFKLRGAFIRKDPLFLFLNKKTFYSIQYSVPIAVFCSFFASVLIESVYIKEVFMHFFFSFGKLSGRFLLIIITICFTLFSSQGSFASEKTTGDGDIKPFEVLKERLTADGFYRPYLDTLYDNTAVQFDSDGVGLFFVHNEGTLDYETFANKTSIWRAKKYIKRHNEHLKFVEKTFGVDKNIITAIILVETGLGTYVGKRRVLNTLSSMAAISEPEVKEYLWKSIADKKRLPRERFDAKVTSKSDWAYQELKAFIKYVNREKLDPYSIYGSYAGALGIAQFMPTNVIKHARDGNGDGKINMLNHSDAISSVASYLKHYGWETGLENKKKKEVLFEYNHSSYYVDILIRITDLLKGKNG